MCAVGVATSGTQNNAKRYIHALLKTRELHQIQGRSLKFSQKNINHFSGGFALESKVLKLPVNADTSSLFNYQVTSAENVNNQNDFNYSQKIFHIADGNLYSILSPVQGRNYVMKPSFLRKQKYTVQESHSRGRRNLRKGLKFHNFLPSESVTSEKDNGVLRTKWKVHSECRLREEHGTKQITISNWSQSVLSSSEDPLDQNLVSDNNTYLAKQHHEAQKNEELNIEKNKHLDEQALCDSRTYNFISNLQNNNATNKKKHDLKSNENKLDLVKTVNSKKGSLKLVLNSLLDKTTALENSTSELPDAHSKFSQNQKHRRKPVYTRRVVPYTKYLSIIEEGESCPLDLSFKSSGEKCLYQNSQTEVTHAVSLKNESSCDDHYSFENSKTNQSDAPLLDSLSDSKLNLSANKDDILVNTSSLAHLLQNQVVPPLVFLSSPVKNALSIRPAFPGTNSNSLQKVQNTVHLNNLSVNGNQMKSKNNFTSQQTNPGPSFSNNLQYSVHKSFVRNSQPKIRRRSQRSVIKKNLEDTFKQNGFLVKTKQVSDGEATFCKFRQLRKYTRYYLKSWQQHLPDEVHKMWKGFLPPKTVLHPVSGSVDSTNSIL